MLDGLKPPPNRAEYCKIADMSAEMKESDRTIFIEAIDDVDNWKANTLSMALRQRGISVADTTINKHRKRACACYRG
jgi:hypothetical protein